MKIRRICWLCGKKIGKDMEAKIWVAAETPNGKPYADKLVDVHFVCYQDMEP